MISCYPLLEKTLRRVKSLFQERVEKGYPDEPLLAATQAKGVVTKDHYESRTVIAQKDLHLLKLVEVGDFVISLRSFQGGIEYAHYRGIISPAYTVMVPRREVLSDYFRYYFKSQSLISSMPLFVTGIREGQNIDYERLRRSYLPIPPLDEQAAIVKYLAHVDQKINRFIRAKRRMIELLSEQKQGLIHKAVTKGLDPDVPMKDSGVEWLGEIPAHWEVITIGAASELIQTGPFGSQLHASDYVSGGTPVVNPTHMTDGNVVPDLDITIDQSTLDRLSRHLLKIGDIVLARRGELGRCAVITKMEEGWLCGTGSMTLRPRKNCLDSHYLSTIISSQGVKDNLSLSSVGSTMDNLNTSIVARQRVPKPPLSEQQCIIDSIRDESSKVERAVGRARAEIDLIREYRTRLVSDVVTGKVDVREAAAGLPEIGDLVGDEAPDLDESLEPESDILDSDDIVGE